MNSYQRLKQKVAEFERDLRIVCCESETLKAIEIVQSVKFANNMEDMLMLGDIIDQSLYANLKTFTVDDFKDEVNRGAIYYKGIPPVKKDEK